MTNQQILERAISKAIDGGWKLGQFYLRYDEELERVYFQDFSESGENYIVLPAMLYDRGHEFAKALWGERETMQTIGHKDGNTVFATLRLPNWQHHLQSMVVSEDPIKYLGEHLG